MEKTETTASATQPQPGSGTEGKRKIAGKFDSLEEAVEQGYVGLEKKVTENNEKLGQVMKLLEDALSAPDPARAAAVPVGTAGGDETRDLYSRGEDFKIDPAQFLADPSKVIRQVEDRAYGRAMRSTADLVANAMVVQEFRGRNQDLIPHEALVASFMQRTDPNKSLSERLENAAKETRTYLGKLKAEWTGNARTPSDTEYVESPGGERPARQVDEGEKDESLADYVKDRHMARAAHFGIKVAK